ncbi:MAG TPA: hypothetical protein VIA62_05345 [Thermoanaerobaculia bacterium]|jgi:hypothetical protein|nr:hypothetical protein [Thermoanaerobaculia bacterium]
MAETQRVLSSPAPSRPAPKPRPRHPSRYNPPLRPTLEEPHDLRPPEAEERKERAPSQRAVAAPAPARRPPRPRSPAERVVLAVLLCGLGLNVAALLTNPRLTRSDLLLGATVFFAGVVLLALMELCRRNAPPAED